MRTKRVLSLLLTCAVLCGMLVLPTAADTASTASTTFTDIADPEVAGAAETLRLLGIVNVAAHTAFIGKIKFFGSVSQRRHIQFRSHQ